MSREEADAAAAAAREEARRGRDEALQRTNAAWAAKASSLEQETLQAQAAAAKAALESQEIQASLQVRMNEGYSTMCRLTFRPGFLV